MGSAETARNTADKLAGRAKEKIGDQRLQERRGVDRVTANLRAAGEQLKAAFRR